MSPGTGRPAGLESGAAAPAAPKPGAAAPAGPESGAAAPAAPKPGAAAPAAPVPAREPVLPEQSREDTDAGWGEYSEPPDDRLYRDRPPHWDDF
jgi:hypothetical protein